jgi:hypothetical protein
MRNVNALATGAVIQVANGSKNQAISIDDLIDMVSQRVLQKLSDGKLIPESNSSNISLVRGVNPVLLRNLAKQNKLGILQKRSKTTDFDELMFKTKTISRLTRVLDDETKASHVYDSCYKLVNKLKDDFQQYHAQEKVLQRGFIKKIIYRGTNNIDYDAHAELHSSLVEAQCKLTQMFDENSIPEKIRNEFYDLIPSQARDLYHDYLMMIN